MRIRKYMAFTPIILGLGIFTLFTVRVFISWITLPPFSIEVEGQFVGFSLLLLMYAYALPITCSFCLAGYLIYPAMFHRIQTPINLLAAFFTVLGVAVLIALPIFALLRSIFLLIAVIAFIAPYTMVPVLAYNVYKTSQNPVKFSDTKPLTPNTRTRQTGGILSLIGGVLMLSSQAWIVPMILMWIIMLPTYSPALQPSMIQSVLFMILYAAIPIAVGVVVLIAGSVIFQGDLKVGGLLAIVFAIQSFSTFGLSLFLGAILALIGGAFAYFSHEGEYGA